MSFKHSTQRCGSYHADVFSLAPEDSATSSSSSAAGPLILFIPGNPGLPAYYEPFLKHLYAGLQGQAVIASISQLEHCPTSAVRRSSTRSAAPACPSLDEQIQSKADFIRSMQRQHPGRPTFVIGHSLGGWMTVQLMKHYPELKFYGFLLFPSLSNMAQTPNGQRLRYVLTPAGAGVVSRLCWLFQLVPERWLVPLVGWVTGHSASSRRVTAGLVRSPATVWQTLAMGSEELQRVRGAEWATLEAGGGRLRCYWARVREDGWVAEADTARIQEAIERGGGQALRCVEGVRHDFCTSDRHSGYMAEVCLRWMREIL